MRDVRLSLFVALAVLTGAIVSPAQALTDDQVGKTIAAMKKYLYSRQKADGSWEQGNGEGHQWGTNMGGTSAIVTLALLVSGESMQHPKIQNAIKYLRRVDMNATYAVSCRAHCWSYLPYSYKSYLEKDAALLLETSKQHKLGLFNYVPKYGDSRIDHSVTQYGMLGLWQASKRGINIPGSFWTGIKNHFIKYQNEDGGWGYGNEHRSASYEAMTTSGLTALLVSQQELYRSQKTPNKEIQAAIAKGMNWMDKRYKGGDSWYGLYGLERVALASGTRFFNKRDWYQSGAEKIVRSGGAGKVGGGHGGEEVATSFALMFLSRGRVPVWINKLEVAGQMWNNRPSDLYFLTSHISNLREGEVNWQVVNMDYAPDQWLLAPVAYLSSNEDLKFTDQQKGNLKQYLDRGGMLLANPEGAYFKQSMKALVEELYPQYKMRLLEKSHPVYHVLHQIEGAEKHKIWGMSNGARELVIMFDSDYGYTFQSDRRKTGPIWDIAMNIFALATNKGVLQNRLIQPFETRKKRNVSGEMIVARAKYDGNWLPEPAAWKLLGNPMFNKTGVNLKTSDVELSALAGTTEKLVHLAGTHAYTLKPGEKSAIKDYVTNGGTVLVETVGGIGDFAGNLEKQLSDVFKAAAVPLGSSDALISGEGIAGGYDCSRVSWRWRTVQTMAVGSRPRLAAILVNGRPAVLVSHEDISLGMMGLRHWHVMGYSPKSAREMATNIILSAGK